MSLFDRAAEFLTDRVVPRLAVGKGPRNQPSRAELELEAEQELQARIDRGRPGPEEALRRRPLPEWAVVPPRPTRPIDVVTVTLDVLAVPPPVVEQPARRQRVSRQSPAT